MSHIQQIGRRWRSRPLLPVLALAVLAGGVGTSAAILGLAWAAVIRPVPSPNSDALLLIQTDFPGMKLRGMGLSGAEAMEFRELTSTFESVGFGFAESSSIRVDETTTSADVARVSAGVMQALAVAPVVGRAFADEEDTPGGPGVAVLQDGFWRRAFGRAPVLGRIITIDGRDHTIIGVLPPRLDFAGRTADVWVPLQYDRRAATSNRANHAFTVIGRLRPGVTSAQAQTDVDSAVERWARVTGQMHTPAPRFHPVVVSSYIDAVIGPIRPATALLVAAVVLVLLAAIANTAGLLAADAQSRRTEFAIRAALGASRVHLWRGPLMETGVLALLAGAGGALVAWLGSGVILSFAPAAMTARDLALPFGQAALGAGALAGVAAVCCALAALGYLPMQHVARTLVDGETRAGASGAQWIRRGLVSLEVALAVVLCAGASVMAESVWRLSRVDLGFSPERVTRASLNLPDSSYPSGPQIERFYQQLTDRLGAIPGVASVGVMSGLPPARRANNSTFQFDGNTLDPHGGLPPLQFVQIVTPDFFDALGVRLQDGRLLTDADTRDSQPVVVINSRAATAFFPGKNPVGKRLRIMIAGRPWLTVVGVVDDVRQGGMAADPGTEIFVPVSQAHFVWNGPPADMHVAIRHTGDTAVDGAIIRRVVAELDPLAAIGVVEPMGDTINRSVAAQRFLAALLLAFAAIAVLLSLTGVYGILTHLVAARTREIGIRRALGAPAVRIALLLARQIVSLMALGLFVGSVATVAGVQLLSPFLFQTAPLDPWRWLALAMLAAGIAALACALPLARALRIDPATALHL